MLTIFRDRQDAGFLLACELALNTWEDVVIVALPHGGVPVAAEISKKFRIPLKVCMVTRMTFPENPNLSVGTINCTGEVFLDSYMLTLLEASDDTIAVALHAAREKIAGISAELSHWRADSSLRGKKVMIVDDVIATGISILGAVQHIQKFEPVSVCVATPIISKYASMLLASKKIDHVAVTVAGEDEFRPQNHYIRFEKIDRRVCANILDRLNWIEKINQEG
jgi:putative phosphoribosyl transferase